MSSYASQKTDTRITDLSQIAEGEVIAGVGSIVGSSGVTIGPEGKFTVTGANADQVITSILSNQDSTVGKLLGLTEQLAQGIFEVAPAAAAEAAAKAQGFYSTQTASIAPATSIKDMDKSTLIVIAILVLFFLMRLKK